MKSYRPYGIALIGGTLAYLLTMALHPTGIAEGADLSALSRENRFTVAVHATGLLASLVIVFGAAPAHQLLTSRMRLEISHEVPVRPTPCRPDL